MTSTTTAAKLNNDRPTGMAWSKMPAWFHLSTFVYFATNVINALAVCYLKAPTIPTLLLLVGLAGGFTEHISPYFPKVYISPTLEKLLFRLPTVAGYLWIAFWMGLAWWVILAFVVHAIVFFDQEALTSMEPRFHIKHVFATHLLGTAGMMVLILIQSRQYPVLNIFLGH